MVCKVHPDRKARRHCFVCRVPICPSCQTKADHHIFCGDPCIRRYREQNSAEALPVPRQLERLDESLRGDFREGIDDLSDDVRREVSRLEDELDKALTSLAVMVEGSATAAAADLEKTIKSVTEALLREARLAGERHDSHVDSFSRLLQQILSSRQAVIETKETLDQTRHELRQEAEKETRDRAEKSQLLLSTLKDLSDIERGENDRTADRLDKNLADLRSMLLNTLKELSETERGEAEKCAHRLDTSLRERAELLMESLADLKSLAEHHRTEGASEYQEQIKRGERILTKIDDLERETKSHSAPLHRLERELADLRKSVSESKIEQERQIAALGAQVTTKLERALRALEQKVHSENQRLLDDVAALHIAHRGNWTEVVHAARDGSEKVVGQLRSELFQQITKDSENLAREQARSVGLVVADVHRELLSAVGDQLPARQQRTTWVAAFVTVFLGLAGISALGIWISRSADQNLQALRADITKEQGGWAARLEEKVGELLAAKPPIEKQTAHVQHSSPAMTRGNVTRREVAFTFDAGGENASAADQILGVLRQRGVRVTMFLTGKFIDQNPEIVRRIAADGHEVGNHLLEHDHLVDPKRQSSLLNRAALLKQLSEVERRFERLTGRSMSRFWRAPYGEVNSEILSWASSAGYTHVGWTRAEGKSLDTLDWVADPKDPLYRSADKIVAKILDFEKTDRYGLNGGVVLMHLGTERQADQPASKLSHLLDQIVSRGYRITRISDILRVETAQR